jgi:nicotinamidase-related amidase/type 1 glutamine amidotransferase
MKPKADESMQKAEPPRTRPLSRSRNHPVGTGSTPSPFFGFMVSGRLLRTRHLALWMVGLCPWTWPALAAESETLLLHARSRVAAAPGSTEYRVSEQVLHWDPARTAVIICDMWDRHWCQGATERVAAMAPQANAFVRAARNRGVLVIHCPSDTLKTYAGTPQRLLAQLAPQTELRVPVQGWSGRDPERELPLPIDDSDGGCDDTPTCAQGSPWTRQIDTIEIHEGDAISDSAEVLHLMAQRGIENAMILGVHLNMCVLGRPFGIRQLVRQGKNVVLVRDLTDTMYNSRRRPEVNHFTGTDLMIEHVEKYWCPSITSTDLLGGPPFRFPADTRPRVLILIGEDEYLTWETLPRFAAQHLLPRGYAVDIVHERSDDYGVFPTLERALPEADLLWLSLRRRGLPVAQLQAIRQHLEGGRPLLAIRTSSHAFAPRGAMADAVRDGRRAAWTDFDPVVLGGNYQGHHGSGPVTAIFRTPVGISHPILEGIEPEWLSVASLYKTGPLVADAVALLLGTVPGQPSEPLAWIRSYGPRQARVFYTSLGHVEDFAEPRFQRLLSQAIRWALAGPDTTQGSAARPTHGRNRQTTRVDPGP